jgi:hypothetical protein
MVWEDMHKIRLEEADEVIVTCVIDNYADRLEPGNDFIHRFPGKMPGRFIQNVVGTTYAFQ